MKRTTTNGDKTVCTKGSEHVAQNTEGDDECFNPTTKKDEHFENWIYTSKLVRGTAKTTIASDPIWIQSSQLGPKSDPDPHPGLRGTKSGKPVQGEAEAYTYSGNLFAEGEPVVRVYDKTLQNSKNSKGEVLPELKRVKPKETQRDDGGGAARKRGSKGKGNKAKKDPAVHKLGNLPPGGEVTVDACSLTASRVSCGHGREADRKLRRLDVVGSGKKRVHLEARVDGRCGLEHPKWVIDPPGEAPSGEDIWFDAATGDDSKITYGPLGFQSFDERKPSVYRVACRACLAPAHELTVHAYSPGLLEDYIDFKKSSWGWPIRIHSAVLNYILGLIADDTQGGKKAEYEELGGGVSITAEVVEFTDHRAFISYTIDVLSDPLYKSIWSFPISPRFAVSLVKGIVLRQGVKVAKGLSGAALFRLLRKTPEGDARIARALGESVAAIDRALSVLEGAADYVPEPVKEAWEDAKDLGRRARAALGLGGLSPTARLAERIQAFLNDTANILEIVGDWIDDEIGAMGFPLEVDATTKLHGKVVRSSPDHKVGLIEIGDGMNGDVRLGIGADVGIWKSVVFCAEVHAAIHATGGGKLSVSADPFQVLVREYKATVQLEFRGELRIGDCIHTGDRQPHYFPAAPFSLGPFKDIGIFPLRMP